MTDISAPKILISPLKPALIRDMAQKLTVLVRFQAPDAPESPAARRPGANIALVLDRSGSMAGEPLAEAVRCGQHMVERLAPDDLAALVVFDNEVSVLVPAMPVGDGSAFQRALTQIREGGSTNLHGGWQAGVDALKPHVSPNRLSRVLLLSDGCANVGTVTDASVMADLASAAAAQGVSTSTYGLGSSFNEDLMIAIGKRGDGNHYYGQTAADLFEPFAEEFDLIGSLHARNVQLTLAVPAGVGLRFLSEHRVESRGGFQAVHLRDLGFGSEAWALIELEVPARLAGDDLAQVLHAAGSASTPEGLPIAVADATLALPGVSAAAWDVLLADERVAARKAEIEAAQLLAQAREAAGRGDWVGIDALIAQAQQQYAGQPWLSEILAHMQRLAQARDSERFSKEALYSSGRLSSRLSSTHELTGSLEDELQSPSFLRRKRAQGQAQFRPTDPDTPDETPQ